MWGVRWLTVFDFARLHKTSSMDVRQKPPFLPWPLQQYPDPSNTRMHIKADEQHTTANGRRTTVVSYGVTDRGRVRRANEDCFVAYPEAGVFVVCDGMGGAAAGETASHLAAQTAATAMRELPQNRPGTHGDAMREAVRQANAAVYQRAREDMRLEGMGTTLVAMAVISSTAWIANVGDSRCYRWRNGELECLTHDHSLVEEQIRIGRMTREQGRRSPMQNVITRAVGTRDEVVPDIQEVEMQPADIYMLASDGLTRDLPDQALAAILKSAGADLHAAGDALVAAANAAGGRDNITCLLVRIGG